MHTRQLYPDVVDNCNSAWSGKQQSSDKGLGRLVCLATPGHCSPMKRSNLSSYKAIRYYFKFVCNYFEHISPGSITYTQNPAEVYVGAPWTCHQILKTGTNCTVED